MIPGKMEAYIDVKTCDCHNLLHRLNNLTDIPDFVSRNDSRTK